MRFALMIEPQQGLTYDEQLAIVAPGRGRRLRVVLPVRPLPELPGAGGQPDDRRLGRPRRAGPRDRRGSGSGTLVSPVTFRQFGNLAKVVTTVDEMSGGRIEFGAGRRLERRRARASSGCRSRRSTSAADMLEEHLAVLRGLWGEPDGWSFEGKHVRIRGRASSTRSRWPCPGRPTVPNGASRPRILAGGDGIAAVDADRRPLRRRVQPLVVVAGRRPRRSTAELDAACEAIGRDPGRSPARRWSGC